MPISDGRIHDRPHRRALLGVFTAAVVSALALGVAQPAQAAAPSRPAAASITPTRHLVAAGSSVVLRGSVTGTTRRAVVVVQQRVHGTRTWHVLTTKRLTATGRITVRRSALLRSSDFRLRIAGATTVSPVVTVTVPTTNTVVAVSDTTPVAGGAIVFAGRTSLGLIGARVRLQRLVGADWRPISSSIVGADGGYTVRTVGTAAGEQSYRTLVPSAAGRPAAASDPQDVTVSAWFRLADLAATASGSGTALGAGRHVIAGRPYLDAIGSALTEGTASTFTFALGSRCSAFRSIIGPDDGSDAGFYGLFRLRADDDVAVDRVLDKGSTEQVASDITGADVLRLTSGALTGSGDAAWGDPEVLCAGI